ncbi:MAG: biotin/lipoyl-containing protein [Kofleriaceae bacterium]
MTAKLSPLEARLHAAAKVAIVTEEPGERWLLASPAPGWFRPTVHDGELVDPAAGGPAGAVVGELEVLGRTFLVTAPRGAGAVALSSRLAERARIAVSAGETLLTLDASAAVARAGGRAGGAAASAASAGLVLRAPSSGRYYGRPGPQKPAFVSVGDVLERGHTVCLLEVMKTFHRVTYDDPTLPERAKVVALLVADDADVTAGQALIEVEPA